MTAQPEDTMKVRIPEDIRNDQDRRSGRPLTFPERAAEAKPEDTMADDAKKLDEWRWAQACRESGLEDGVFATTIYRRLVVENARPPELVDDGLEAIVNKLADKLTLNVPAYYLLAALRTELAARGLAVRPVVEMTRAELHAEMAAALERIRRGKRVDWDSVNYSYEALDGDAAREIARAILTKLGGEHGQG